MRNKRKILSLLISAVLIILFAVQTFAAVTLPSISSITSYTINSSGKVYAYTASDLKKTTGGYIACSTDECQILKVSGNAVQVKYPVSGGTKTAWFKRSEFTSCDLSKKEAAGKWTQASKITTYRRSDGKTSFGYVSAGDVCYKLTAKGNYTQILYPISGNKNYKMGWVKTSDISSSTDSSGGGTSGTVLGYEKYTGVNYSNAGISLKRVKALDKAKDMVTIKWTAPCDFPTWCSSGGVYNKAIATDKSSAAKFVKGKTYTGIPYSMADNTYTDSKWSSNLKSMTTKNMSATYYKHGKNTTAHGIDCSYFVYTAFKAAEAPISYETTSSMLKSSNYEKLSGFDKMIPGDIFLKNGHVMLYVGKSGSNYAVFEADAEDSKCSYNVYSKSSLSSYSPYRLKYFK